MTPLIFLIILAAIIFYLGTGSFGRNQTQAWIDRVKKYPAVHGFLNKHHGKFRASGHYIEFGGLFLVLYWCWDSWFSTGHFSFSALPSIVIAIICAIAAYLDEVHQLQSGTRQFRRVDFFHSLCGIHIAMLIVAYQDYIRFGI